MIKQLITFSIILILSAVVASSSVTFGARPTSSIMTAGFYVDVGKSGERIVAANRWGIELFDVDRE